MQPLSNEAVLAIIGIAATLATAYAYLLKRRADAALEKVKAQKRESDARAEQVELDAKSRLRQAEADASARESEAKQAASMLEMMNKQIIINRQQQRRMDAQKKSAEEGYQTIRAVQNDTNIQLSNMYNALRDLKLEMVKVLSDLPTQIQAANHSELTDFAKMMAGEIAVHIVEQFERQKIESTMFPFPDPDDPDWREETIIPLVPDVTIRKEPRFWDNALLQKPCAQIIPGGERVRIITDRTKDWVIVDKIASGERCWGWIKAREVRIEEVEGLHA